MSHRSLLAAAVAAGAIAGCGSSSPPRTIAQLCGDYAGAVKHIVPNPVPYPVPQDFAAKLGAQADRDCVTHAVQLGYAAAAQDPRRVKLTASHAAQLIHDLTAGTAVHVSY